MTDSTVLDRDGHTRGEDGASDPYLKGLQKLGQQVYFYHPVLDKPSSEVKQDSGSGTPQPDLIIVCSWMAASTKHIAKYTNSYLSRYQHTPTLLLRSSQADVLIKPEQDQVADLKPAITAIQSVFASIQAAPRVLLHCFSNGGSWSSIMLAKAYKEATFGLTLPISAIVFDSCPSLPHIELSHLALSAALPRNFLAQFFGSVLIYMFLYFTRFINQLGLTENLLLKIRRILNDPMSPYVKGGVPRVYICSKTDKMVPIEDVKQHSEDAQQAMSTSGVGKDEIQQRVTFEEFDGSPHVGHLMVDAGRYWNIVNKVWMVAVEVKKQADLELQKMRDKKPTKST